MNRFEKQIVDCPEPRFDVDVAENGYRWWYVDGVSADGQRGIVVIAFVGSVFSPYYYRARQRSPAQPEHYCAINVALYDNKVGRWCMTERSTESLSRDASSFAVAASSLQWTDDELRIQVSERSVPWLRRVTGEIVLRPRQINSTGFVPDTNARHLWQPIAPLADIEVRMTRPSWSWNGSGYFDTNTGAEPLETGFRKWSWSRSAADDSCRIDYAIEQRDSQLRSTSLRFDSAGNMTERELPPRIELDKGLWQVSRHAFSERYPHSVRDLEDTPFYTRSILDYGERHDVHEFLDLDRFRSGWVRFLLPFRMPRLR